MPTTTTVTNFPPRCVEKQARVKGNLLHENPYSVMVMEGLSNFMRPVQQMNHPLACLIDPFKGSTQTRRSQKKAHHGSHPLRRPQEINHGTQQGRCRHLQPSTLLITYHKQIHNDLSRHNYFVYLMTVAQSKIDVYTQTSLLLGRDQTSISNHIEMAII